MSLVQAPTNVFTIVGRHAVDGAADIPNVEPSRRKPG